MGSFTYRLSLWARHADADLSDIAVHLRIPSDRFWRKGEARKAPNGRLQSGVYKDSFCRMQIAHEDSDSLPDKLKSTLKKLKADHEFFNQKRQAGVSFSFHIGLFMDDYSCGELFDHDMLTDMASLGIALGLNIYAPEENKEDGAPDA